MHGSCQPGGSPGSSTRTTAPVREGPQHYRSCCSMSSRRFPCRASRCAQGSRLRLRINHSWNRSRGGMNSIREALLCPPDHTLLPTTTYDPETACECPAGILDDLIKGGSPVRCPRRCRHRSNAAVCSIDYPAAERQSVINDLVMIDDRRAGGVTLITGVMAAGKSTVVQALAERLPRSVHVRGMSSGG